MGGGDFFHTGQSFSQKGLQSSRIQVMISYGLDESALLKRKPWEP